jgi:hypothetical protein
MPHIVSSRIHEGKSHKFHCVTGWRSFIPYHWDHMEFRLQSRKHAPAQTNVPPSKMMTFVSNGIERGEGNVGMFPFR